MGNRKTKLAMGIAFILFAVLFVLAMLKNDLQSYMLTGAVLCVIFGIGFIRSSRRP